MLPCFIRLCSAAPRSYLVPGKKRPNNALAVCARVVVTVESCRPARRGADLEQVLQTARTHPGILAVCARQRDRAPNVTPSLAVCARQRLRRLRAPT